MSEDRERQPTEIARLTHDEASEILSSLLVGMAERGDTSPGVQRVAERAYAEIHRVEQSLYRQEIAAAARTEELPQRSLIQRTVDTVNGWLGRGDAQQQKAFEIEPHDRARAIAQSPHTEQWVTVGGTRGKFEEEESLRGAFRHRPVEFDLPSKMWKGVGEWHDGLAPKLRAEKMAEHPRRSDKEILDGMFGESPTLKPGVPKQEPHKIDPPKQGGITI